ncbi:ammonium transporter [Geminocystis sp. NIES-3708]|uniref:ammonium transporter n=1 Tax=Geminocystis sp. NIES-3708 TaxID=1615909 RepID=UPI0005FCDB46|nr:ammonium transporter [Geminocystis sp. NIES-3708]BAQ61509.1 ammonium transporter [Geminocystis sp. NIES-3708]
MIDQLWLLICSGLVLLMQGGFMCLESGLTRSKNSINVAVKNFADFAVSVLLFWAFGYALMFGVSQTGWFGTTNFFFSSSTQPSIAVFFIFQAMFCGTSTTIISGAVAERLQFIAYLIVAILVSAFIYPLFGNWAWNDHGWLKEIGFIDFAGSTVVHSIGAWVSLGTLMVIGARNGRFSAGKINKIQGSNLPFAVLGALLLWVGWIGFNGGSTFALNEKVPDIILHTILSGVGGMICGMILSYVQNQRIEVEELINGSLAGLVGITASCHLVSSPVALMIGVSSAGVTNLVSGNLKRWGIDDAVDAVPVHGGAGIWGTICVGLFGNLELLNHSRGTQILIQLTGISVALLWAFGLTFILLSLINRYYSLRVSAEDEEVGLNISEHGASTDTYELFSVMDTQARNQDLTLRVPVQPFTEIGHIAHRYNQVMDALEVNHRQNVESLEELYTITATAVSAIENNYFQPSDFDDFCDRPDDLGILARALQQMLEKLNKQQKDLICAQQQLTLAEKDKEKLIQDIIMKILETRFPENNENIINLINSLSLAEKINLISETLKVKKIDELSLLINNLQ